ncbi:cell surface glycoprotein 1-like [Salvia splendens]|uniref:cell surface glycoprotein 1-like n=1 Tax=Salvia splendens TaxID=180675 RepID=UPI001C2740D8|nr:cell surface glycoprotein 1-like [Salvia splendens]
MGNKKWAKKITSEKPTSNRREETLESQPTMEEQPSNPQPPEPTPQAPTMVSLDVMTEFLRQQDPSRDWAAELAGFSRIGCKWSMTGETPAVPTPEPNVQPTAQPPTSIPTSSTITPEREPPSVTEPSESAQTPQPSDSMDVDPISAYYDSEPDEREARRRNEEKSQKGGDEPEKTPTAEPIPQEMAREEIDLNETARKQGLMTDEEFQALLDEVNQTEDGTATMARV